MNRPRGLWRRARYTRPVETQVADVLRFLEPHALLLAIVLPPVIRMVGHLIPEELFMVSIGVLAARSGSPTEAGTLLGAVLGSHLLTDHALYVGGRWLHPRIGRFPHISARLTRVTDRLQGSPAALLWLVPARVLPLGRAAWIAGCGVVRIRWPAFLLADLAALLAHVVVWCGLGWWLADDLQQLASSAEIGVQTGIWAVAAAAAAVLAVVVWRCRARWQEATAVLRLSVRNRR